MRTVEQSLRLPVRVRHHANMTPRTDLITASQVDLTLILLPAITWLEASFILAASGSGVPPEMAARVIALPLERRTINLPPCSE